MDNAVEIDLRHSHAITQQIGEHLRVHLIEEGELPDNLRVLLNRFQEIEGPKEPPFVRLA